MAFIGQHSAIIGLVLLLATFVFFAMERRPPVVIAVLSGAAMIAFGFLSKDEALAIFGNSAPITIAAMFILSGALLRTGALEEVSGWVIRRTLRKPKLALAEIGGGTLFASAFMNNTPVVIVMIPIVKRLARVLGVAATRLMIPLSYICILGGTMTLIGTSTNLLVDGVAQEQGQEAFGIFEITAVGTVGMLAGLATMLVLGPILLPSRGSREIDSERESDLFLTHLILIPGSRYVGQAIEDAAFARRPGVKVLGLMQGRELVRSNLGEYVLGEGDQLVVAASPAEIASLAEARDFRTGITGLGGGVATALGDRPADLRTIEAVVSARHPIVGRRLAEIPFLSRLRVRLLGLSRPRHVAGPTLADVRVQAGDRLLIAAGDDAVSALQGNMQFTDVAETATRSFRRGKAPLAIGTLAAVVIGAALFDFDIATLALLGVAFVLLTRCVEPEEAWASLDGSTLVLIFGMLAFGKGLENAGTIAMIVDYLRPLMAAGSPLLLLLVVYAVCSLLTEVVTNNAVAVIMTPIAIGLGQAASVDPRALVVAVMMGASASFATPIGYQTNTLVYGAANYRFSDFARIGIPMNIIVGVAVCLAIHYLY